MKSNFQSINFKNVFNFYETKLRKIIWLFIANSLIYFSRSLILNHLADQHHLFLGQSDNLGEIVL